MSATTWIAVALLGGLGAVGRFVLDGAVSVLARGSFPVGTLAVNLSGAFALGVLAGATADTTVMRLAATGFLGAYTTFSTWMFESQRLAKDGELGQGLVNLAVSLVAGIALSWAGLQLGAAL